ncbi:hypothetical protein SDC9_187642 [bioreactor metagenome]|uniref:Uncharacterized protein n=1 Tax=bioreactor metagenome TaxID=1076179 RepID=A0A645HMD3_9ZZZZ
MGPSERAAMDGRILDRNIGQAAVNGAVSGYDAITGNLLTLKTEGNAS